MHVGLPFSHNQTTGGRHSPYAGGTLVYDHRSRGGVAGSGSVHDGRRGGAPLDTSHGYHGYRGNALRDGSYQDHAEGYDEEESKDAWSKHTS